MVTHILISVIFYFVLLYLSVNLLGFLVRGFFVDPELNRLKQEGSNFVKQEIVKLQRSEKWINITGLVLIIAYLYSLFYFWNIGVMIAAIIVMIGRFPDLLWEIKHGKKMTYSNANSLPHNIWFFITAFLPFVAFPVLYYSLYFLR